MLKKALRLQTSINALENILRGKSAFARLPTGLIKVFDTDSTYKKGSFENFHDGVYGVVDEIHSDGYVINPIDIPVIPNSDTINDDHNKSLPLWTSVYAIDIFYTISQSSMTVIRSALNAFTIFSRGVERNNKFYAVFRIRSNGKYDLTINNITTSFEYIAIESLERIIEIARDISGPCCIFVENMDSLAKANILSSCNICHKLASLPVNISIFVHTASDSAIDSSLNDLVDSAISIDNDIVNVISHKRCRQTEAEHFITSFKNSLIRNFTSNYALHMRRLYMDYINKQKFGIPLDPDETDRYYTVAGSFKLINGLGSCNPTQIVLIHSILITREFTKLVLTRPSSFMIKEFQELVQAIDPGILNEIEANIFTTVLDIDIFDNLVKVVKSISSPLLMPMGFASDNSSSVLFCRLLQTKNQVLVSTSDSIAGYTITKYVGLVSGSTVRTRDVTKDVTSMFTAVVGGEMKHYTQLLVDSREEALDRMKEAATAYGANAVISTRIGTSNIAQASSEVLAYGTAVVCVPKAMEKEGFIRGFIVDGANIKILLKYFSGAPVIREMIVVSRPSRKIWLDAKRIQAHTKFNTGTWFVETPHGIITHRDCLRMGIGGKVIFAVNVGSQRWC